MITNYPINKSKLVILLYNMDEKDFKDLGLWVHSPFHNSSKSVIKLYGVLKSKYRKTGKSIGTLDLMKNMEIVPRSAKAKDVSPKHKQELRKTMCALTLQIENLFVWKKTQEDTVACKYRLMEALIERQSYELIPPILSKARKIHESSMLRDVNYCRNAYRLAEMDFHVDIISEKRNPETGMKNIAVVEALKQFCFSQLLRYYCAMVNSQKVVKVEEDCDFLQVLKHYMEQSGSTNSFTVRIYYMMLRLLEDEQPKDYDALKKYLLEALHAFSTDEIEHLLGFMSNYCNRMINYGQNQFIKEKFELYTTGLNHGCWTANTSFSSHHFVQIFRTALLLDKTKWAYSFLDAYASKLPPQLKDSILNYCHALSAFDRQQYDTAQTYLNQIDRTKDFIYQLGFKILLTKVYYDKNDFTFSNVDFHPINYELDAIKQYVLPSTNKNMSEYNRIRYSNFANFFKRILNRKKKIIYGEALTQTNLQTLQNDLAELKPLIERTWLEEKIGELMQEVK